MHKWKSNHVDIYYIIVIVNLNIFSKWFDNSFLFIFLFNLIILNIR
jgi:hypothetical protein